MNDDLYKLIPEEGKHLAKSKDTDDAYRGVYLDDETNKPCGAGEFVKVNPDELLDREETEPIVEDSTVAALLVAIGVAIGIGAANPAKPTCRLPQTQERGRTGEARGRKERTATATA